MGCDTVLRSLMHLLCTDLDLKRLSGRSHQRCVQGLIHIRLRHRDIIFKTSRDRRIHLMDHAKRRITVFHGIHNDPNRKQIVHLIQSFILIDHFLVDAEKMLHSSVYFRLNMRVLHMRRYFRDDLLDKFFPLRLTLVQIVDKLPVHFRLGIF